MTHTSLYPQNIAHIIANIIVKHIPYHFSISSILLLHLVRYCRIFRHATGSDSNIMNFPDLGRIIQLHNVSHPRCRLVWSLPPIQDTLLWCLQHQLFSTTNFDITHTPHSIFIFKKCSKKFLAKTYYNSYQILSRNQFFYSSIILTRFGIRKLAYKTVDTVQQFITTTSKL